MAGDRPMALPRGLPILIAGSSRPGHVAHRLSPPPALFAYASFVTMPVLSLALAAKQAALRSALATGGPVLIAYSGGVDSAFLAWSARIALGDGMLALIADSPSLARAELRAALAFAAAHEIPCEVIETREIEREEYRRNAPDRCFFCKDELFTRMEAELRRRPGFATLAYGLNCDDRGDFRPGRGAAEAHGVRAPLVEAGLGKEEIRALARAAGLELWDKPAAPCLASRVAYGLEVTPAVLARIEAAEAAVRALGFREFRVRYHGAIARLEVGAAELPRALEPATAAALAAAIRQAGFRFATLDLEPFRSGSLNRAQ